MLQIKVKKCWKVLKTNLRSFDIFLSNGAFWGFLLIYVILSRNFYVEIYALFLQIFCDWKADSANFYTFRMYASVLSRFLFSVAIATPPIRDTSCYQIKVDLQGFCKRGRRRRHSLVGGTVHGTCFSYSYIVKVPELQLVCFSKVSVHKWIWVSSNEINICFSLLSLCTYLILEMTIH